MRSELTNIAQIDEYLSGGLSPADHAAFETKIAMNPDLANTVNQQKDLLKAINRKALRAEINTIAAGAAGSGFSNFAIGVGSVTVIGLITAAAIYFYPTDNTETNQNLVAENEILITEVDTEEELDIYTLNEDAIIIEEPETIFSSTQNYELENRKGDNVNVTVDFRSSGEGKLVAPINNNGGIIVSEVKEERNEINIDRIGTFENRKARATFPGGNMDMKVFMDKHLNYPKSAKNKGIEGVVKCTFHVTEDGLLTEIKAECIRMNEKDGMAFNDVRQMINKRIMNAFIDNATHILRTMPNWEPAKNAAGNSILSAHNMYFNYDLDKGCLVYQLEDE